MIHRGEPRVRGRVYLGTVAVVAALLLSGCTNASPVTPSASAPVSGSPAPSPAATTAAPPVLQPAGTARDNLPLFTSVTQTVWAASGPVGRAYIDALVAAGFDKTAMQVTNDKTTIGDPAESIQFSVRWGSECLVGQVGPTIATPVTAVLPVLGGDVCLLGNTRPIDW